MKRTCKQCGREFELSPSEIAFYEKKNLSLPKRCEECRKENHERKKDASREMQPKKQTDKQASRQMSRQTKGRTSLATLLILLVLLAAARFLPDQGKAQPVSSRYAAEQPLTFRSASRLEEHYEKHGKHMGFSSAEEYEAAAAAVVTNPVSLHKTEKEDGDDVYYLERTNEFVIVSRDGYLRTYFQPDDGIDYFERQ